MRITKNLFLAFCATVQLSSALALPKEETTTTSLAKRAGCPHGGVLLYSNGENAVCLGAAGIVVGGFGMAWVVTSQVIAYVHHEWDAKNCPNPATGILPNPSSGGSGSSSKEIAATDATDATAASAGTVTGLYVEITEGYQQTTCREDISDNYWANSIVAMSRYMEKYGYECIQAVLYDDGTGSEASIRTWLKTKDGKNHRSC